MSHYIEKTLEQGESIIFKGNLHWYFNFRYTVWGILLNILGVAGMIYVAQDTVGGTTSDVLLYLCFAACLIGVASIAWGYFLRIKTEFAITATRFIQKDGILNIHLTEIPLFKVETVNFEQSLIERIVGTGAIELVGSGGTNHKILYVQNPMQVRNLITTYMKENKQPASSSSSAASSAPTAATASAPTSPFTSTSTE